MEKLTELVEEVSVEEGEIEIKPLVYEGLELVSSVPYAGPTSIKYWM